MYCPRLRKIVPDSLVPDGVNCVYEIVVNGLSLDSVKEAMAEGIKAAAKAPGIVKISAGNYGGKFGPIQVHLHEILGLG